MKSLGEESVPHREREEGGRRGGEEKGEGRLQEAGQQLEDEDGGI